MRSGRKAASGGTFWIFRVLLFGGPTECCLAELADWPSTSPSALSLPSPALQWRQLVALEEKPSGICMVSVDLFWCCATSPVAAAAAAAAIAAIAAIAAMAVAAPDGDGNNASDVPRRDP